MAPSKKPAAKSVKAKKTVAKKTVVKAKPPISKKALAKKKVAVKKPLSKTKAAPKKVMTKKVVAKKTLTKPKKPVLKKGVVKKKAVALKKPVVKTKVAPKKVIAKAPVTPRKVAPVQKPRLEPVAPTGPYGFPEKMRDAALKVLDERQAEEVVTVSLAGRSAMADYAIIASGRSGRQLAAIAEYMSVAFAELGYKNTKIEGVTQGDWILVDAGDVIVHLFRPEVRRYYHLEDIWNGKRP